MEAYNLNKGSKRVSEPSLRCNGELTRDSSKIANAFNSYFTQIGPNSDTHFVRTI